MKNIAIIACILLSFSASGQGKRMALLIGNADYRHGTSLKHPVSDVYLMGFTLEDLGFEVISLTNATLGEMKETLMEFWQMAEGAEAVLFYYAGHGVHLNQANFLIPADARLKDPRDLKKLAVDADQILRQFGNLGCEHGFVILDACREEAFAPWVSAQYSGFNEIRVPDNTLLAYSCSPGNTYPGENEGANGLYAEILTGQMMVSQSAVQVFSNTAKLVSHKSGQKQDPREWSQLDPTFSFIRTYIPGDPGNGSIMLTSKISGTLSLDGLEIDTVESGSSLPFDNIKPGTYTLSIAGENPWQEEVLVLGGQVSNVVSEATTAPEPETLLPGGNTMTDKRDGAVYSVATFGKQTWMTMNLAYEAPGSHCYENSEENCAQYGRLYTWETARDACPDGWHLPTDEEWITLERHMGMKKGDARSMGLRSKTVGHALKDTLAGNWSEPKNGSFAARGFNALAAGFMLNEGTPVEQGRSALFWTASEYSREDAYYRKVEDSKGGIHRYHCSKDRACSIRCIRD